MDTAATSRGRSGRLPRPGWAAHPAASGGTHSGGGVGDTGPAAICIQPAFQSLHGLPVPGHRVPVGRGLAEQPVGHEAGYARRRPLPVTTIGPPPLAIPPSRPALPAAPRTSP